MNKKEIVLNQLILNMDKPTGLTPLELRNKLLKLKKLYDKRF